MFATCRSSIASSKTSIDKSLLSPNKEKKMVNNNKKDELRKVCATFDKNSNGFITKQELTESLRNIRIFMTEKEVEEMLLKLDAKGDDLIDFEEFGLLCESMTGGGGEQGKDEVNGNESLFENEEDLKEAFDVFDRDKDGRISVEELGSILSSLLSIP
ncbi:calmodulin-like protein 5 [Cannabis sativa]|nr:calmodulin-like protein 5 [Cannabis sativa]